ncbi:MAG: zinc-ribbon domain-containing protein [Methanosphaera sp.]|nr:zinc-ribbon domain-containing protein [Methanosphaera sp.]
MIKCSNCGEMNSDESKFCSNCGSAFETNTNTNNLSQNMSPKQDNNQNFNNHERNNFNQNNYNGQQNESIKDKISNLSTPVKVVGGILILCCIGVLILAAFGGGASDQGSLPSDTNYSSTPSFSFTSSDKAKCKEINYKEINKNPDKYVGEYIKVSGKVMQISESSSYGNSLLMYVGGDYSQLVYVEYLNETNIVEDDWITVYGICEGSYTYDTKIGGSNTVPYVKGGILEK